MKSRKARLIRKLKRLKKSTSDRQLNPSDRLLLDILSEIVDILISDFRETFDKSLIKRKTSSTSNQEIDHDEVRLLRDILKQQSEED